MPVSGGTRTTGRTHLTVVVGIVIVVRRGVTAMM